MTSIHGTEFAKVHYIARYNPGYTPWAEEAHATYQAMRGDQMLSKTENMLREKVEKQRKLQAEPEDRACKPLNPRPSIIARDLPASTVYPRALSTSPNLPARLLKSPVPATIGTNKLSARPKIALASGHTADALERVFVKPTTLADALLQRGILLRELARMMDLCDRT